MLEFSVLIQNENTLSFVVAKQFNHGNFVQRLQFTGLDLTKFNPSVTACHSHCRPSWREVARELSALEPASGQLPGRGSTCLDPVDRVMAFRQRRCVRERAGNVTEDAFPSNSLPALCSTRMKGSRRRRDMEAGYLHTWTFTPGTVFGSFTTFDLRNPAFTPSHLPSHLRLHEARLASHHTQSSSFAILRVYYPSETGSTRHGGENMAPRRNELGDIQSGWVVFIRLGDLQPV